MKRLFICLLSACFGIAALAQETHPAQGAASQTIRAKGCVMAGVESGCKILKNKKSGESYTLFFPEGKEPPMNSGIFFTGTPHQGMTTCMQGNAVDVTTWTPAKMNCAKAKDSAAPAQ